MNCAAQEQAAYPQGRLRGAMRQDHVRGIRLQLRCEQVRGCLIPEEQRACNNSQPADMLPLGPITKPARTDAAGQSCKRPVPLGPLQHSELGIPGLLHAASMPHPNRPALHAAGGGHRPKNWAGRRTHATGEAAVGGAQARVQAGVQRRALACSDGAGLQVRARAVRDQHALLRAAPHLAPAAARGHTDAIGRDTVTSHHHVDTTSSWQQLRLQTVSQHALHLGHQVSCHAQTEFLRPGLERARE